DVLQYLADSADDEADDSGWLILLGRQRVDGRRGLRQGQVEELDLHLRLTEIDADEEAVGGIDLEDRARPPDERLVESSFEHDPLAAELVDDVRNGGRAKPGLAAQPGAARRAAEVELAQDARAIPPAHIANRGAVSAHPVGNSSLSSRPSAKC